MKTWKWLGMACIAGAVAFVPAISGNAKSSVDTVTAVVASDIHLRLNGEAWQATDTEGNVIYPVVIDGVSYLPVRALAVALDTEIGWEDETRTIWIGGDTASGSGYNGEEFKQGGTTGSQGGKQGGQQSGTQGGQQGGPQGGQQSGAQGGQQGRPQGGQQGGAQGGQQGGMQGGQQGGPQGGQQGGPQGGQQGGPR